MEQQANAPPQIRQLVSWLRSTNQIPLRNGLLGGTRYPYFHGTRAVAALLSPQYKKYASKSKLDLPVPQDEAQAEEILHNTLPFAFFLRVERGDRLGGQKKDPSQGGGKTERLRELKVVPQQMFKKELHFAWFYAGSQLSLQLMSLGMLVLLLAGVMFPLWPPFMRLGVWYLSMGFLGLVGAFFGLAILRLIMWGVTTLVGKGWWLFPNLFADVGFVDSFIPVWEWDLPAEPKKSKKSKRSKAIEQAPEEEGEVEEEYEEEEEGGSRRPSASGSEEQGQVAAPPGKKESEGLDDLD